MCDEIWTPIDGYEGFYEVSNLGRIRRISDAIGTFNGRVLSLKVKDGIYRVCCLYRSPSDHKSFRVCRIVAKSFHGEPPSKNSQVNHKNGIKNDDRAENLEWVTPSENVRHRFDVLGIDNPKGENHKNATFTDYQVSIMKALRIAGASNGSIARQFNAKLQAVKAITSNRNWSHVKPIDVIPDGYSVCELPKLKGSNHHQAKITEEDVRYIRSSSDSGANMARKYGITQTAVCNIRKMKTWRHVK